jgi:hypothetical protein
VVAVDGGGVIVGAVLASEAGSAFPTWVAFECMPFSFGRHAVAAGAGGGVVVRDGVVVRGGVVVGNKHVPHSRKRQNAQILHG